MAMNFQWTEESTAQLRELWLSGLSGTECGKILGLSRNSVIGKVARLGIGRPSLKTLPVTAPVYEAATPVPTYRSLWAEAEINRAIELRKSGMIVVDIAMALGRSFEATKKKLKDLKISVGEPKRVERTARPFIRQIVERPASVVSLFDLRHGDCRWPFGDPGDDDFGFCGQRVEREGSPYCACHRRIAYVPAPKMKPNLYKERVRHD